MLQYIEQEANKTATENGAATHLTTGSDCLDLFATVGALRRESEDEIVVRFLRAFAENRDVAMKLLFFARDIRGGLGERRVFRVILHWLAEHEPASVRKNLAHVAEYGRFDDLLCLMGTPCEGEMLSLVQAQLGADLAAMKKGEEVSLLAKWLPSVNASSAETVAQAKRIARHLGMKDAEYRRTLVALRAHIRILENHLRERDYSFDYAKQPSKALYKYRKAFLRNDGARYEAFAAYLCKNGYVVVANDHLGHGLSRVEGRPMVYLGDENGWENVVEDMENIRARTAKVFPGKPYFLFGHSMGSFLARTYLIRYPDKLTGCVLCGTGHMNALIVAAGKMVADAEIKRIGATAYSEKIDQLAFGAYNKRFAPNRTAFDWLSVNEKNVDAYIADPLCGGRTTLGLFRDMMGGIGIITDRAKLEKMNKNLPVFFIAGDEDPVGDMGKGVEKAYRCFKKAGMRDVSIKLYHGLLLFCCTHTLGHMNDKNQSNKFLYHQVLLPCTPQ